MCGQLVSEFFCANYGDSQAFLIFNSVHGLAIFRPQVFPCTGCPLQKQSCTLYHTFAIRVPDAAWNVILTLFYSCIFNLPCVRFCKCNFATTNPFADAFTLDIL